jgi:hypothetical protein
MAKKAETETNTITIPPLKRATARLRIVGTTGLFQNRMSEKMRQYFLAGGGKKTKAEKVGIKHDPLAEYRNSAEVIPTGPTALGLKVIAVKSAMADAAIETPGVTKTAVQRLLFMPGEHAALYGTPQLRLDIVRSADMAKTPDMRSRCFLPKWGAEIDISFITPQLSATSVITLLCNSGILIGVGDFRQQKGKGSYGCFRVLGDGEEDSEWNDLVANHGRDAQVSALATPEYANEETAELMRFYENEVRRRAA